MSLFRTKGEPYFAASDGPTELERKLEQLQAIENHVTTQDRRRLERDIRLTKAGISGERQIAFELKNSHLPIGVVHDLNLEHDGLQSQIDFLVVMPYVFVVLECKNLVGNITVTKDGDFIRRFGNGYEEGIYSPITQNERHLALIKQMLGDKETNSVMRALTSFNFKSYWKSLIVLANPKGLFDVSKAPKDIRRQIVRSDQLINRLKELNERGHKAENARYKMDKIREVADRYAKLSVRRERDWTESYALAPVRTVQVGTAVSNPTPNEMTHQAPSAQKTPVCPICGSSMILRTARRGPRAGKQFWGCSNYPYCHGIINI